MTTTSPLAVVRAYHEAWTESRFADAAALLAPGLEVEVPINDYPTRESFAKALAAFGPLVTSVELLSELCGGDEVVQLYDMEVTGLGAMRVAEHFTVNGGRIVRLRQVHDTAPFRGSYDRELVIAAPPTRILEALTTSAGLAAWWMPLVAGDPVAGDVRLGSPGDEDHVILRTAVADDPPAVDWMCLRNAANPEWRGTTMHWTLAAAREGRTIVRFRHEGLVPRLECYHRCERGWYHFLASLGEYVEGRGGSPYQG